MSEQNEQIIEETPEVKTPRVIKKEFPATEEQKKIVKKALLILRRNAVSHRWLEEFKGVRNSYVPDRRGISQFDFYCNLDFSKTKLNDEQRKTLIQHLMTTEEWQQNMAHCASMPTPAFELTATGVRIQMPAPARPELDAPVAPVAAPVIPARVAPATQAPTLAAPPRFIVPARLQQPAQAPVTASQGAPALAHTEEVVDIADDVKPALLARPAVMPINGNHHSENKLKGLFGL